MVDTIKIYVLKEPDTLIIRYVGMTSKTLKQRLRKHLDNALYTKHNPHLCNWILKYYKKGQLPIIEIIEKCDKKIWQEREKYWINYYNNLLNSTEGGEGSFGFKHSKKSIEKIRNMKLGIRQSKKTRLRRSVSLKGRIITKEHRIKIGNSNRGREYTKYNIKIVDNINNLEHIFNTTKEVSKYLNCGKTTIYRYLDKEKLFRKQYFIVKI